MLIRRLSKVVLNQNSLFKVKFTGNLSGAALTSFLLLGRLERKSLEDSLNFFQARLFDDISKLPKDLEGILKDKQSKSTSYLELFDKLTHIKDEIEIAKTIDLSPPIISESLKTVYEFLDKSRIGFLSGDFNIDLIEKLINNIGLFENKTLEENHEFLKKVEEYIRDQDFCLPKNGIKKPALENPQALYIREAFIERDSPEILMKHLKSDAQVLTHGAFSLNFLTPKEHLVELHANLASRIRKEQTNVLQKQHPSFSKNYSTLLV
jgi:hypothetical protein